MPHPLTYTDDARARIVAALKAGSSLRDAVGFAGVPWDTFIVWLRAGRRVVDGAADATRADARFEALARDIDQAAHESTVALTGIMRKAAEGGDWRAAEALLKIKSDRAERRLRLRRGRAEALVAEKRAEGTLVERHEVTEVAAVDEIRRRIARLAESAGAGGGALLADASGGDGAAQGVGVLVAAGASPTRR